MTANGGRRVALYCRFFAGRIVICGLCLAMPTVAQAINWMNVGRQSPMSQFDQDDVELFIETGTSALNEAADGTRMAWENKDTGHSGSITPVRSYTRDGEQCRIMTLENQSRSFFARSTHHFCKGEEGVWKWAQPQP